MAPSPAALSALSPPFDFGGLPDELQSRVLFFVAIRHRTNAKKQPNEFTIARLHAGKNILFKDFTVNRLFNVELRKHFFSSNTFKLTLHAGRQQPTVARGTTKGIEVKTNARCPTSGGFAHVLMPHPAVAAKMRHVIFAFELLIPCPARRASPASDEAYSITPQPDGRLDPAWLDFLLALPDSGFIKLHSLTLRLKCGGPFYPTPANAADVVVPEPLPAARLAALGAEIQDGVRGMMIPIGRFVVRLEEVDGGPRGKHIRFYDVIGREEEEKASVSGV